MNTLDFIEAIFGDNEGYVFISTKFSPSDEGIGNHKAFKYPATKTRMAKYVDALSEQDVYFSPMLYRLPKRVPGNVVVTPVVYADTDTFPVDEYRVKPSINIETSPGRHASFWLLDRADYEPKAVEAAARAIAMQHASKDSGGNQAGVDPGGWDLSQLLRMPNSHNLKYEVVTEDGERKFPDYTEAYSTFVTPDSDGSIYSLEQITEHYEPGAVAPRLEGGYTHSDELPDKLPKTTDVLRRVAANNRLNTMYDHTPTSGQDWSDLMYAFVSEMLRSGFTPEETFVVAWNTEFNKYKRDNRPKEDMWRYDISKALKDPENVARPTVEVAVRDEEGTPAHKAPATFRPAAIGTAQELQDKFFREGELANLTGSFISRYTEWAMSKSPDSARGYHIAGALAILSCIFGEWGRTQTEFSDSFGLGLFFVLAGETTKTRKSTARDYVKEMLRATQIGNYQYLFTSDITPETLIDELAKRPYRASMFDRDEVQDLIEGIKGGKGYLKGLFTTLNELYDGWAHARHRKGNATEETPVVFVQFFLGIRSQIQENLELSDFASGWGPRNIFVRGEVPNQTGKRRRNLRRGSGQADTTKRKLAMELMKARDYWKATAGDFSTPAMIDFSEEAWDRLEDYADLLEDYIKKHPRAEVLDSGIERLGWNLKKTAALLAMADQRDEVSLNDALTAIYYATQWTEDLIIMVEGVASNAVQRDIDAFLTFLELNGGTVYQKDAVNWAVKHGKQRHEYLALFDILKDGERIIVGKDTDGNLCLQMI